MNSVELPKLGKEGNKNYTTDTIPPLELTPEHLKALEESGYTYSYPGTP